MDYDQLKNYIERKMVMQHIYQPVMLKTFLQSKEYRASVAERSPHSFLWITIHNCNTLQTHYKRDAGQGSSKSWGCHSRKWRIYAQCSGKAHTGAGTWSSPPVRYKDIAIRTTVRQKEHIYGTAGLPVPRISPGLCSTRCSRGQSKGVNSAAYRLRSRRCR